MASVGDINSIFIAARILGSSAYVVAKDDLKVKRPRDVIFIIFSMAVYLSTVAAIYIFILAQQQLDTKSLFFNFLRVALVYSCFFVDATLTTLWISKIRAVFSELRNFDRVMKFRESSRSRKVRFVSRIVVLFTLIYWSVVGYLSCRIEKRLPILRGLMYTLIDAAVSLQILIFVGISFLVGERFRQLCKILTHSMAKGKLIVSVPSSSHFTLQQIWWLHCCLVKASELFNSVYAVQLLLWISTMSLNAMSRIYTLNVYHLSSLGNARESMLAIFCGWNLILITTSCHMTAYQANHVGEIIFTPCSSISMKRVFLQENLEAAAYFQLRKLRFSTVAGFIRVDLSLLLSVSLFEKNRVWGIEMGSFQSKIDSEGPEGRSRIIFAWDIFRDMKESGDKFRNFSDGNLYFSSRDIYLLRDRT
ncbi:uncharacterized protein LOC143182055 [Calliopsis andreniformis]|uniref:uncharacterized protein LOC143182055 n=1 Tax=Calliopsis andreniformis TaxID=337506 RepID=UPI003FCCC968